MLEKNCIPLSELVTNATELDHDHIGKLYYFALFLLQIDQFRDGVTLFITINTERIFAFCAWVQTKVQNEIHKASPICCISTEMGTSSCESCILRYAQFWLK